MTEIETWSERGDMIEFKMKRLNDPIDEHGESEISCESASALIEYAITSNACMYRTPYLS